MASGKKRQLDDIVAPHENDVLSGRGNFVNFHEGNEYFRTLVRKHKVAYVACPKRQKVEFSRLIVKEIKSRNPPGRFLKQDAKSQLWHDVGEKKALDKTRQALREGAPDIAKKFGEGSGNNGNGNGNGNGACSQNTPKFSSASKSSKPEKESNSGTTGRLTN